MNKLDLIFSYIREYKSRFDANVVNKKFDDFNNEINPNNELFYFICDLMGYSKFSNCVTEKNYQNIKCPELYHGYYEHSHGANYLWDFNFHYGKGEYGQGTYFSTDYEDAMSFTGGFTRDYTRVLKAKLLPCKVVKYSDLKNLAENNKTDGLSLDDDAIENYNQIIEFIDSLQSDDDKNLMNDLLFKNIKNFSSLAVLLGYDLIENDFTPDFFHGKHFILLNRGKLIVSQKDVKTLLKKSGEKYQGFEFLTTDLSEIENV